MKKILSIISILIVVITLSGCSNTEDVSSNVSLTNYFFNTTITISIYDSIDEEKATSIINNAFSLCKKYENLFSRTISSSEISKINNSNGKKVKVSNDVYDIIKTSLKYSTLSNGSFDITIAPLTTLWNIDGDNPSVPKDSEIKSTLKHVNFQNIKLRGNSLQLTDKNSSIDLGGIAKGYIADKLKTYMQAKGVKSAIINLGGNILTIGSKTDNTSFNIGIQKPFSSNQVSDYIATIKVKDKSVVTSGIYQRYFKENGIIYHHILDSKTGYPIKNNLYSVTIISNDSIDGDALSTAIFALGYKKGSKLINSLPNIECIFVTNKNQIILSKGLTMNGNNEVTIK